MYQFQRKKIVELYFNEDETRQNLLPPLGFELMTSYLSFAAIDLFGSQYSGGPKSRH